jgi:glycosyltransferase involved in cell wall biosynthesis/2-polyprenyl-3-methyl-5-hydroxy-6-metoxy-1,4-benzoquinol methylase
MRDVETCLWCGSTDLKLFAHRKDGVGILKCNNCQLYMVAKIPNNLEEYYYKEEYFNAGAEENGDAGYGDMYDLMAPAFLLWQNSFVEEVNESHAPLSFLEIGCATGNLLEIMREFQKNLDVQGIDISEYAIKSAREKGFDAKVAYIQDLVSKPKKDIIFSAETLEHLDDLKSFLGGVTANLKEDGVFLFYVPSISVEAAQNDIENYVRFNTNLEHILHFTPEFFERELPKFFNSTVLIKEITTGFGPCILGAVSSNPARLTQLEALFETITTGEIPDGASDTFLKNLAIFALKFEQVQLATKVINLMSSSKTSNKDDLLLLRGLSGFHSGQLIAANASVEAYLQARPGSLFAIRSLLSNERELTKVYQNDINRLSHLVEQSKDAGSRAFEAESKLRELKQSKIVGSAILLRRAISRALRPVREFRAQFKPRVLRLVVKLTPPVLRPPLRYVFKLQWLVKRTVTLNAKHARNQPLISVVTAYYNAAATIDDTLNSLRAQTFKNFEVIIVSDASSEQQSVDKLSRLDLRGLNATVLSHDQNRGPAAARNSGIAKAKGKYIVCLDSDDMLSPTYLEKCAVLLETDPMVDIATTDMHLFGVKDLDYRQKPYGAFEMLTINTVIVAAMFSKAGWTAVGGYKSGIGYEDWEFWVNLAENGFWGRLIPEVLFRYRTSISSKYVSDQDSHRDNLRLIRGAHPRFGKNLKSIARHKAFNIEIVDTDTAFINLADPGLYEQSEGKGPTVLVTVPWMTFGGAETLIYNYCREVKDKVKLNFVTGLKSEHEWEHKFKEITPYIYHLANLFEDKNLYIEFISNYITTRHVDVLHIIHNGFTFDMLAELRQRHPKLKVAVTLFNDRVEYFDQAIAARDYIDSFTTDNEAVAAHYRKSLGDGKSIIVIPNGVNCVEEFNPDVFDVPTERQALGIADDELAVYFVGRLSEEKNPNVFLDAAKKLLQEKTDLKLKFFVIGDGPMRPQVEKAVSSMPKDKMTYLGYKTNKEIGRYLSTADIFVLPSAVEGFPLGILEAMSMEVAVIASRVGAVPDIVVSGTEGLIVTPGSAKEIVEGIRALCADPKLLRAMQAAARRKVTDKYSNVALGKNYRKLYESVVGK